MNPFLHPSERRALLTTTAVVVLAFVATPCAAEPSNPVKSLKSVEQLLDETRTRERKLGLAATEAETKIAHLRQRSIAIAARIQEHEGIILTLEDKSASLEDDRRTLERSLKTRRKQLVGMLAALQRIALHPPVALIALPMEPVDTIRSALLLRNTVPAVQVLGHALREDLDAIKQIKQAVLAARAKIEEERAALEDRRATLAKLTTQKGKVARTARRALRDTQEQAARLGKEARDLRDLVNRLTRRAVRRAPGKVVRLQPVLPAPDKTEIQTTRATDGMPVRGRIARPFGAKNKSGQRSHGVLISTRPASTVVAPRDGEVVFAGPFRGFGNLLIIEYRAKYHLLLGGLARIDTQVGEKVLAGEPVGVMQSSEDQATALYMELRRNGQAINPLPWLAAGRTRVNG